MFSVDGFVLVWFACGGAGNLEKTRMISHAEVIRRLRHERMYWRRQLRTDHENGIIRGLEIAIVITQETRRDCDKKEK